ncbi:Vegetative incompatibility protein HET-E-1 [Ceratocystis fimbriata CBS 114723]|uniref:Vegetative incompatibility protein HET-E-1 n=1 Tax=Ceratocystis fimbriata CBS 114723 TaxID=1035309 RepID=A0A2C5XF82_9PEZI|nr:Vegetative incompatibility protein HET-E-1 [Ceratocystis fimbriata CBS 114723]
MLGRLKMGMTQSIEEYKILASKIFVTEPKTSSKKRVSAFSAKKLEAAIKRMIHNNCTDPNCPKRKSDGHITENDTCPHGDMLLADEKCTRTAVLAMTKANIETLPTFLTTYHNSGSLTGCKVWEAARATSAAINLFDPINLGRDEIQFIDASYGYNNPCEALIWEAEREFPGRPIMILSIGTGLGDVVEVSDSRDSVLKALRKTATSFKQIDLRLEQKYNSPGVYFRFNVQIGLRDNKVLDRQMFSDISAHTVNYLKEKTRSVERFVDTFTRNGVSQPKAQHDENDKKCLSDLCITDPSTDKRDIESRKGSLLKDSYRWILSHENFQQFLNDSESPILWIKGDPGKGKTMLLCGIIDELERTSPTSLSYFFCQATNDRLNTATSVLRGLIYHLACHDPRLTKHVRKKHDLNKDVFRNEGSWHELCDILGSMLDDPSLENAILIVDALDECIFVAYRPLTLEELCVLVESLGGVEKQEVEELIALCGSFLTIHNNVISFVHQSAKDYFQDKALGKILPFGIQHQHQTIFSRSLDVLHKKLRRDIYNLTAPGCLIEELSAPQPDPLVAIGYSCFFWVDHLNDSSTNGMVSKNDEILAFLSEKYLQWLEAVSLLRGISIAGRAMEKLKLYSEKAPQNLRDLVNDAHRFFLLHAGVIEIAPLQVYSSALIFSPTDSLIRRMFCHEEPEWIELIPKVEANWDACPRSTEGHHSHVISLVFSNDGQRLASGSYDKTVKIWDTTSGACLQTLEGHHREVTSAVFSNDGQRLASVSYDKTVKIWDTTSGACLRTLEGHTWSTTSVVFSNDGQRLASGSYDKTVKIWDTTSGACLQTLEGHCLKVTSVVFSDDGQRLASGSWDSTVKVWDATSGACLQTLEGHYRRVTSAVFSTSAQPLVSSFVDQPSSLHSDFDNYCISRDHAWVLQGQKRILCLPPSYRPVKSAIACQAVGFSISSGRIMVMRFGSIG